MKNNAINQDEEHNSKMRNCKKGKMMHFFFFFLAFNELITGLFWEVEGSGITY